MIKLIYGKKVLLVLMPVIALLSYSCSTQLRFPDELKLERVIHAKGVQHAMGPGGLNQSFTVFELNQEVSETISNGGLPYLNSLPSVLVQKKRSKPPKVYRYEVKDGRKVPTMTGPWWGPFIHWHATPVPKEEKWLRYGRDLGKDWKPSIITFYKSYKSDTSRDSFISTISPEFIDLFHEAISTPGNFYAYGNYRDMNLLVVSPRLGKAFYAYRD